MMSTKEQGKGGAVDLRKSSERRAIRQEIERLERLAESYEFDATSATNPSKKTFYKKHAEGVQKRIRELKAPMIRFEKQRRIALTKWRVNVERKNLIRGVGNARKAIRAHNSVAVQAGNAPSSIALYKVTANKGKSYLNNLTATLKRKRRLL